MIHKYRKKPVIIHAVQYDGTNYEEISNWANKHFVKTTSGLIIPTLEGDMVAKIGDYIIKGVAGEHYPCKPDIFNETYEEV